MDKILVSIAGGVPYDLVCTGFYSPIEEIQRSAGATRRLFGQLVQYQEISEPIWNTLKWQGKTYVVPQNSALRHRA